MVPKVFEPLKFYCISKLDLDWIKYFIRMGCSCLNSDFIVKTLFQVLLVSVHVAFKSACHFLFICQSYNDTRKHTYQIIYTFSTFTSYFMVYLINSNYNQNEPLFLKGQDFSNTEFLVDFVPGKSTLFFLSKLHQICQ